MDREQIRQVLLDILAKVVPDEDPSSLRDDLPFRDQLDLDSMDFLDIVMELRKRFRIQIPEEDYERLTSMKSAIDYLEPHLAKIEGAAHTSDSVRSE